jgi:hypothetical protein
MTAEVAGEEIEFLAKFKKDILAEFHSNTVPKGEREDLRVRINRAIPRARELLLKAGTLKRMALAPPTAIGGMVVTNADPFDYILESYYGMSLTPAVANMIEQAIGVMESPSYLKRIAPSGTVKHQEAMALARVIRLCERFPLVVRELRDRYARRASFQIEDEHDLQDLFRAFLRLDFDDVRHEEWAPSYAGGASRLDFLLKKERLVVETKKTRQSLGSREVGDELLVDIGRYQSHSDCDVLVCFVYDPETRIANPAGLIRDLNGKHGRITVHVVIAPGASLSSV